MRVLHVFPYMTELACGPCHSIPALCDALAGRDLAVSLHVLAPAPSLEGARFGVREYPSWPVLRRLGISPRMRRDLTRAAATADIIHNHALWTMPNVYPAWAVRGTSCRLVTSPRGSLAPWGLNKSRWRKVVMWSVCQGQVLKDSACLHATAENEYRDIRRVGLRAPVTIVPNGVEIPELPVDRPASPGRKRLLFLGRIHPVKGIDFLLKAWRNVQAQAEDWELHLVGPEQEGYLGILKKLAADLRIERVTFRGPVHGQAKTEEFRRADLFVLPSHTENFGMAVAEALAHGVPAIVSQGAPWAEIETRDCGWWIALGEGPLTECLRHALALSRDQLRARGARGREWMVADFSWTKMGQMMHETYLWLLGGGMPPPWVRREN
ncbi:MAG: glycosyltransferase [Planctomycetes bacterium]|nr:glycosyltransferase [Planctomycetota bacterium]